MKNEKTRITLFLILLLALFLRTWGLNKSPLELFGDEVDAGYQAYSLLKTGRDYRGNLLPIYAESFAEPRAPLLFYFTVPFVALFGLNEWGVRLPSVFFGVLSILILYFLVKEVIDEERLALGAAIFLTVTPWHINYSRAAFEVSLLLFLILSGTLSFFKALKGRSRWWLVTALLFGLTFYTYNTANVFVPLWGVSLLILFRRELCKAWRKSSKAIVLSIIAGLLLIFPLVRAVFFGSAGFRFGLVSIFSDPQMVDTISFKRSVAPLSSLVERFFHNKLGWWFKSFWLNYIGALSFQFLFVSGDPNPRHSLPGFGLFFLSFLPLLLTGIYQIIKGENEKNEENKGNKFLLVWLILTPIPASLTVAGGSHATRLFIMLPPLIILIAKGLSFLLKKSWGKLFLTCLTVLLIWEAVSYSHELLVHYPKEYFRYWHYGYKQVLQAYNKNAKICEKLYLNNSHEPFLIRYLFWTRVDPMWFLQNFKGDRDNLEEKGHFRGFSLGNTYFIRLTSADKLETVKKILAEGDSCYVAFQGDEVPGDWDLTKGSIEEIKVLGKVDDPNGRPYIYLLY